VCGCVAICRGGVGLFPGWREMWLVNVWFVIGGEGRVGGMDTCS
jgi:hypothetical protein